MKETIEWFRVTKHSCPNENSATVLMKIESSQGGLSGVVSGEFYKSCGFVLYDGEPVDPTMWCYMPKGPQ